MGQRICAPKRQRVVPPARTTNALLVSARTSSFAPPAPDISQNLNRLVAELPGEDTKLANDQGRDDDRQIERPARNDLKLAVSRLSVHNHLRESCCDGAFVDDRHSVIQSRFMTPLSNSSIESQLPKFLH